MTARLESMLPIRRVVGPADIAALAVHLMTNTAVTSGTSEIDGGQHLVEGSALAPEPGEDQGDTLARCHPSTSNLGMAANRTRTEAGGVYQSQGGNA